MTNDKNIFGHLQDAFAHGRASHAYIVVGEKHQLPELLKQCALVCMCPNHADDGCAVCQKVQLNLHQDVLRFPADPQRSRVLVADMEKLVEETYKRPIDNGDCRVYLIDASSSTVGIGTEAWQNKLLKTLEEPIDGNYIFIGVTDAESLLPTIRSRCQVLHQTKLSNSAVCQALIERGFDKKYCEMASCVSDGSVQTGEIILSNPAIGKAFQNALNWAQNMISTKVALKYVAPVLADKDTVIWFFKFLAVIYRESIVYRLSEELCQLPSYKTEIAEVCKNYTLQAAEVCIEKVNSAKKRLDDGGNVTVILDQLASTVLEVKYRCRI